MEGDGEVAASDVVVTVPADAAAALLDDVAPDAAGRLGRLHYNPLAIVHLETDGGGPRGLGYQVAFGEPLRTRGVTFNDSLFGREGIRTAFLGGARDPDILRESDERIGAIAAEELGVVTGSEAEVLRVTRTRVPAWDRSWTALEGLALPPRVHLCTNYESRIGIPGRIANATALARRLIAG
jgi:oxygen-dependent protoporphyrinogen oxidase